MNNHLHEAKKISQPHYHGYSAQTIQAGILQANVAIAETLQEIRDRLPERPMQVIPTPSVPQDTDLARDDKYFLHSFPCEITSDDSVQIYRMTGDEHVEFKVTEGDREATVAVKDKNIRDIVDILTRYLRSTED